ncbi:TetR/AcrR family transcriptional regulator [Roseibium sp.]|uniref:TetR/AcrR family transcriptional regulator n=1 Tax=Roseibium sp. TaxID=1936156 RepID=UPI003A986D44
MTRKPQQRTLVTRARILSAAESLSGDNGLEGVTAEAIAEKAGVAKGTIFAHFGDMDGLQSYLLLDRLRDLQARSEADGAPAEVLSPDPVAALMERMMALVSVISESQTMLRVFMENIGVTKGHCAPDFVEALDALDGKLKTLLEFWQASEDLKPALRRDRSPEEMVDGLIAFMLHGAILYHSHQIEDLSITGQRLQRHVEAFLLEQGPNAGKQS